MLKGVNRTSVSALAIVLATVGVFAGAASAEAQTATTNDAAAKPADAQTSESSTNNGGGADIVVTARRRNELEQDVPIAVSAISGDSAMRSGVSGTEAIAIVTPSMDFSRQISQGATPFLRGVGAAQAAAGGESPVAVYIDDVYIGSPNGNLFSLSNVASIQVLKGPQGTLFGRNATGGVMQVTTKRPSQDASIEASVGYGNYDRLEGSVYATTGLGKDLAINIAASGRDQRDGYGRSLANGHKTQLGWDWNVRSELLWTPGSTTKILVSGDYSEQKSDFGSSFTTLPGTISLGGDTFAGAFNTNSPAVDFAHITQAGASVRIDQETSFADLVSISAYRKTKLRFWLDYDNGLADLLQVENVISPTESISQEFQIVSKPESKLKWILGAYYLHTYTGYDQSPLRGLAFGGANQGINTIDHQKLDSIAGFGEASYEILPRTNLTAGLRYTKDSYKLNLQGIYFYPGPAVTPFPGTTYTDKASFPKLTYRAILDHKFGSNILAYVSYSRGFKSGGYNLTTPLDPSTGKLSPPVRPEVLDAYEIGLKTKLFDGKLTLNGSAYHYDYTNLQVQKTVPGGSILLNAAAARINGIDVDFIANLLPGFRLAGGFGIIDSKYKSFPSGPLFLPNPATCTPTPMQLPGPATGGNLVCAANLAGNRTARSPKFTLSLSPSYVMKTGVGDFTLAGTFYHNSGFFWEPNNRLSQPEYNLLNGSLSWDSTDRHFGVQLWMRNITDQRYYAFAQTSETDAQVSFAAPRTFGFTLTARQ